MKKILTLFLFSFAFSLAFLSANAAPIREWDWHLPGRIYKELEFTDRAAVDRAVKIFQQAVDAEYRNVKVTDLVPRYRAAAGEFRKVQVQGESSGEGSEPLLAYAVFMQGYARQQAHDRNEAIKLYNEVLDIYPEQKFIAVPARYMLSRVKREMGDIKQADEDIQEIIADKGADGHPVYACVFRDFAWIHWGRLETDEAIDCWRRLVFELKGVDGNIWRDARGALITALIGTGNFAELEKAVLAGAGDNKKRKADLLAENANWMSSFCRQGGHPVAQFLERKFPVGKKDKDRAKEADMIRRGYLQWFDSVDECFVGEDDGWRLALLKLHLNAGFEKSEVFAKRLRALEKLVRGAKPDQVNGRARTLAWELMNYGQNDSARAATEFCNNIAYKLRLKYDVEVRLNNFKAATLYLEELVQMKPPPENLQGLKYELADHYLRRTGQPDKAVKLYLDINDPPRSLWGLSNALRASGKKAEAYTTLTEIASIFPNDAPEAVLTMARWRESDGQKDKAIALYRRLLSNPEWKKLGQSSAAHQALERLGIATGGAMVNEVR